MLIINIAVISIYSLSIINYQLFIINCLDSRNLLINFQIFQIFKIRNINYSLSIIHYRYFLKLLLTPQIFKSSNFKLRNVNYSIINYSLSIISLIHFTAVSNNCHSCFIRLKFFLFVEFFSFIENKITVQGRLVMVVCSIIFPIPFSLMIGYRCNIIKPQPDILHRRSALENLSIFSSSNTNTTTAYDIKCLFCVFQPI